MEGRIIRLVKYFVKVGERYNRLEILATQVRVKGKKQFYNLCRCDCGNECYRTSMELARGRLKSCGCGYREAQKRGNFIHGGSGAAYLYGFWLRKRRGGRGITLAERWQKSYAPFRDWIEEHLGPRPSLSYRLERWDRGKGVEPGNLLWVTGQQQYALRKGLALLLFLLGFSLYYSYFGDMDHDGVPDFLECLIPIMTNGEILKSRENSLASSIKFSNLVKEMG